MSVRRKIAIVSLVNTLLLLWFSSYSGALQASFLISFIFFVATLWIIKFDVLPVGFTTVLGFPTSMIFVWSLFYLVSPFFGIYKLIFLIVFFSLNYMLFLNANIINVASIRKIALIQLSQTLIIIFSIATIAILVLLVELAKLSPLVFVIFLGIISSYMTLSILLINEIRLRYAAFLAIINAILLCGLALVLSLLVLPYEILAVSLAIAFYVLISTQFVKKNSLYSYFETPIFLSLIVLLIFFFLNR